jgi:hypothetical protein
MAQWCRLTFSLVSMPRWAIRGLIPAGAARPAGAGSHSPCRHATWPASAAGASPVADGGDGRCRQAQPVLGT